MEKLAEPFHFPVDRWRIPLRLVEPHVFVGRQCATVQARGAWRVALQGALLLPMLISGSG